MWLLNTKTLQLREFSGELPSWRPGRQPGKTPHYAILSHCWRDGEVLFHDIQDLDRARGMAGFPKIEHCCEQALKIGYKWAWVDTCCIDKSSSAELSEAINSMFKWYGHAGTCLIYLDDVDHGDPRRQDSLFRKSRWFTRGWTLQELLAPKRLVFFSKSWSFLGTKGSLLTLLSAITKIPVDALSHNSSFSSFSIAQRMSWAAKRRTTRIEDQAYSLMGLFSIFMPIIYGEGSSAFRRLQLEIIQRSSDQTIFAWSLEGSTSHSLPFFSSWMEIDADDSDSTPVLELPRHFCLEYSSILAPSPADFQGSGSIVPLPVSTRSESPDEPLEAMTEYSWTHLGLHIHMSLIPVRIRTKKGRPFLAMLSCWNPEEQSIYGIMLLRNNVQDPYRCYNLGVFGSGVSDSSNHLVSITKKDYDEVVPKFPGPRDIYITNQPDPGNDSASDSAIGRDSPVSPDHGSSRARLLIVFPGFSLKSLEEMGFFLAGHAARRGPDSPQDMEVRKDRGGDVLLEFQ